LKQETFKFNWDGHSWGNVVQLCRQLTRLLMDKWQIGFLTVLTGKKAQTSWPGWHCFHVEDIFSFHFWLIFAAHSRNVSACGGSEGGL